MEETNHTFPLFICYFCDYFDLQEFSMSVLFFHNNNSWLSLPFSRERRYSEESCSISLFPLSSLQRCFLRLLLLYYYFFFLYAIFCHFIGYLVVCLHLKRAFHGLTIAEEILFTDTCKIVFTHCNLFSVGKGVITCSGTSQGLWVSHQRVQTQPAGFSHKHVWRQDVLFLF